jgi:hypothetical protein
MGVTATQVGSTCEGHRSIFVTHQLSKTTDNPIHTSTTRAECSLFVVNNLLQLSDVAGDCSGKLGAYLVLWIEHNLG